MNPLETDIGGPGRQFPSTSAFRLTDLRDPRAPEHREALQSLIARYWKPVYCLIRHSWGRSNEEAKDLTQQFFVTEILEGSLLDNFVPGQGRLRSFLKGAVANFMGHVARDAGCRKRGGDVRVLSFNMAEFDLAEVVADPRSVSPEEAFDQAWKQRVFAQAVGLVERRLLGRGKHLHFEVFKCYDLEPQGKDVSYKSIGESLGLSVDTVKNYLTSARDEFANAVAEVVRDYVRTPEDLALEMHELFGL